MPVSRFLDVLKHKYSKHDRDFVFAHFISPSPTFQTSSLACVCESAHNPKHVDCTLPDWWTVRCSIVLGQNPSTPVADHLDLSCTYGNMGDMYFYKHEYPAAVEWYGRALRVGAFLWAEGTPPGRGGGGAPAFQEGGQELNSALGRSVRSLEASEGGAARWGVSHAAFCFAAGGWTPSPPWGR